VRRVPHSARIGRAVIEPVANPLTDRCEVGCGHGWHGLPCQGTTMHHALYATCNCPGQFANTEETP